MNRILWGLCFGWLCLTTVVYGTNRTEPWVTETAIAFLDQYLKQNPNAVILEFGSGSSTLWFAKQTPNLHSIEHSKHYFGLTKKTLLGKAFHTVHYQLFPLPYYGLADAFPDAFFDLILVDGRNRKGCIVHAIPKLKAGGVLMLDNAERTYYHSVFSLMEDWEYFSTEQTKTDKFGFWYHGWKTDWWIKPLIH